MKYMIIAIMVLFAACASNNVESKRMKIEPLPPEKLHDLLHINCNLAYKSVTKEDYEQKEFN